MSADAASGKAAKGAKQTGGQKADAKLSARVQRAAEKQRQAELELLLMDDTALGDVARGGGLCHSSDCPVQSFNGDSTLGNGRLQPEMAWTATHSSSQMHNSAGVMCLQQCGMDCADFTGRESARQCGHW